MTRCDRDETFHMRDLVSERGIIFLVAMRRMVSSSQPDRKSEEAETSKGQGFMG